MSKSLEEIVDFFDYADSYFKACRMLVPMSNFGRSVKEFSSHKDRVFRVGPIYQNLGLAAELTFKTALLLSGSTQSDIRNLRHDLEKIYEQLCEKRDLDKVEKSAFQAAVLVGPPEGMFQRLKEHGQEPHAWFHFATHIRSLNNSYSVFEGKNGLATAEKFRSRYPANDRAFREVCIEALMAG
ncbi:hypothetical protein [Leisingera caerulea]|uniref:HEPN domain-containing protein n=1 Tax=Leisingera caerulea TaxID=506591 RepID=A0A9Q9HIA1_LEICA|nr:hypothetical protein [Leisingera caerulea]UWQ52530.1 hypothetical protein K3721_10850 [Leisingera caerulea]